MIAGPLLLTALPLLVSPLVWLLRRWATVAALLAASIASLMALMAWRLPLDRPVQLWGRQVALGETVSVLGRELVITPADRWDLVLIFLIAAGLFLFASRVSQGWTFYPLGLALLSVLSITLLIESHIFAVLFLQIAAALCVFLIQGGQVGSTRGALRFLTFVTLAIPPLLVTGWLLGRYELTPDETGLLDASAMLFAFGFAILLGVIPFHTWISAVGADAPPLVSTFVLGLFYAVVWFVMLDLIDTFDWLAGHPDFRAAFSYSAYAMIVVGATLAAVHRRLGHLMGYAALVDMGAAQLALGLQTSAGLNAALFALGTRALSLTVMAMGMSVIRHRAEGDFFYRLAGWGRRVPWATAALVVGALSLAGLPPGPGFTARWSITRLLAREQVSGALLLLLGSLAVGVGVVRALMALLQEPAPGYVGSDIVKEIEAAARSKEGVEQKPLDRESRLAAIMIVAALILCLILVLWPQIHTSVIQQVVESYTFLP
jgi:formate hydrogenlyase subunit 3/multisubunit Na+/H+ antiporter MnhD subunit